MEPTDITIEILKGIRDRLDGTNDRLERIERRQNVTETRIATELVAVAGVVQALRDDLKEERALEKRVADHERRLQVLESHAG